MDTLNASARLLAALAATAVTFGVFAGIVSFAEPQRSTLIAKTSAKAAVAAASAVTRVADAR